ncbi:dethiobiotin synthase [Arsenophonus sp. aPb]|uniref:dethiobiotin synthase n=1 Tax=Arsenophonus sp. aPb TaxID=3041619 RepID=UPI00246917EB|nr:dethiobiotin synthase [Arsenophonus sp. aPb]WGL99620.1 dethiobiotin synthase [Arsenophonus sp. aPb]
MLTSLFITGTNTNVGKTIATRALLQTLNDNTSSAIGYKPIIKTKFQKTSVQDELNKFTSTIIQSSPITLTANEIKPVIIQNSQEKESVIDFNEINKKITILRQKANYIIIEGCGGWRHLLDQQMFYSDWVIQQKIPVILVVGIQPGCINHAVLTAHAIIQDGIRLIGWIANRINPGLTCYAQIIDRLQRHIPAPKLGEIPYLLRPEERNLSEYIDKKLLKNMMKNC